MWVSNLSDNLTRISRPTGLCSRASVLVRGQCCYYWSPNLLLHTWWWQNLITVWEAKTKKILNSLLPWPLSHEQSTFSRPPAPTVYKHTYQYHVDYMPALILGAVLVRVTLMSAVRDKDQQVSLGWRMWPAHACTDTIQILSFQWCCSYARWSHTKSSFRSF